MDGTYTWAERKIQKIIWKRICTLIYKKRKENRVYIKSRRLSMIFSRFLNTQLREQKKKSRRTIGCCCQNAIGLNDIVSVRTIPCTLLLNCMVKLNAVCQFWYRKTVLRLKIRFVEISGEAHMVVRITRCHARHIPSVCECCVYRGIGKYAVL